MKYPVKVTMPPGLMRSSHTGKTYIVAGCMIPVPDGTTKADMHKYVTYEPKKPEIESWKVESDSGSIYTVTRRNGDFSCSCAGFKFYRKCKHIRGIIDEE